MFPPTTAVSLACGLRSSLVMLPRGFSTCCVSAVVCARCESRIMKSIFSLAARRTSRPARFLHGKLGRAGQATQAGFYVGGSTVIDVLRIPLPKDRLRAIPKEERALLFLLGYAANQITLFSKLVIFLSNKTPSDPVEQQLSDAQSLILGRVAIGVLAETWELIHKRFLGTPRGKEFEPAKLNPAGREALETLKKYFSGSNILSKLRNNVAFHHPCDSDMDAGFEAAASEKIWDSDWNCIFHLPCITRGILRVIS